MPTDETPRDLKDSSSSSLSECTYSNLQTVSSRPPSNCLIFSVIHTQWQHIATSYVLHFIPVVSNYTGLDVCHVSVPISEFLTITPLWSWTNTQIPFFLMYAFHAPSQLIITLPLCWILVCKWFSGCDAWDDPLVTPVTCIEGKSRMFPLFPLQWSTQWRFVGFEE